MIVHFISYFAQHILVNNVVNGILIPICRILLLEGRGGSETYPLNAVFNHIWNKHKKLNKKNNVQNYFVTKFWNAEMRTNTAMSPVSYLKLECAIIFSISGSRKSTYCKYVITYSYTFG